jgi:hypothetical protein
MSRGRCRAVDVARSMSRGRCRAVDVARSMSRGVALRTSRAVSLRMLRAVEPSMSRVDVAFGGGADVVFGRAVDIGCGRRHRYLAHPDGVCGDHALPGPHPSSGALALSAHMRSSTAPALSPPKLLGAEGRGLTPVARRAQVP